MAGFLVGMDRGPTTLLPECLDDWVDESNPVLASMWLSRRSNFAISGLRASIRSAPVALRAALA